MSGVDFHIQAVKKINPDFQPYLTINALPGYFYSAVKGLGIITLPERDPFIEKFNLVKVLPNFFIDVPLYLSYHIISSTLRKVLAFENILEEIKNENNTCN